MNAPTILTGDRPTGPLHLGHFVGSLRQRVALQHTHNQFVLIADLQGLTDNGSNPQKIRDNIPEIVHKMNSLLPAPVLRHCKAMLSDTSRLPGIDGGAKMSKSLGNTLHLSASEETIHRAVSAMYTDPHHLKVSDPGQIEGNVVFTYLDAFHPDKEKVAAMKAHYQAGGLGDRVCKNELEACLQELIAPMRERRAMYMRDKGELMAMLKRGTERAQGVTQETLREVKVGLGVPVFS